MNKRLLKKVIGTTMFCIGMFLAICTTDGCRWEIGMRLAGVTMFAIGAGLAEAYDWQN